MYFFIVCPLEEPLLLYGFTLTRVYMYNVLNIFRMMEYFNKSMLNHLITNKLYF